MVTAVEMLPDWKRFNLHFVTSSGLKSVRKFKCEEGIMKEFVLAQIQKAFARLKRSIVMILKVIFIIFVNLAFWLLPLIVMGWLVVSRIMSFASDFTSAVNLPGGQYSSPVRKSGGTQAFDVAGMLRSAGYLVQESRFWKK